MQACHEARPQTVIFHATAPLRAIIRELKRNEDTPPDTQHGGSDVIPI